MDIGDNSDDDDNNICDSQIRVFHFGLNEKSISFPWIGLKLALILKEILTLSLRVYDIQFTYKRIKK